MNVLVTGGDGQLGWELKRLIPDGFNVYSYNKSDLDITDVQRVRQEVSNVKPDYIINFAAYTAVDGAEQEKELAFKVNAVGASNIASAAVECNARIIHISTDFVFDGKASSPYKPEDNANPLNVYGKSKYEGETQINKICNGQAIIIRSSWIYSSHGKNFVKTMLNLMKDRTELKVVCDQIGTPTWAKGFASFIWHIVNTPEISGTYHWTDTGIASWYDFAVAILEEALHINILMQPLPIIPIMTDDYPTPAKRPPYSVLDKTSTWAMYKNAPHWRTHLRQMLEEYNNND